MWSSGGSAVRRVIQLVDAARCVGAAIRLAVTGAVLLLSFDFSAAAQSICTGDCNGDNQVTVDELIGMVNVALGNTSTSKCSAGDANQDNQITVDEIIAAVNDALSGCPPLQGQLNIAVALRIPAVDQAAVLANRGALESLELSVAADGSLVTKPPVPGSGWFLKAGAALTLTDASGRFSLDIPAGETDISIFNPSDHDHPVGRVATQELASTGGILTAYVFTDGPCGMNVDDAHQPASCHSLPGGASEASFETGEEGAPGKLLRAPMPCDASLGSCPPGDQSACEDQNGVLCTQPPSQCEHTIPNYFGSTCYFKVEEGCCTYERAEVLIGGVQVPNPNPRPCVETHKGRFCQEVVRGDLSIRVAGHLASEPIIVEPGGSFSLTVHNNACFGETLIATQQVSQRLGGSLAAESLDSIGPGWQQLRHYDMNLDYTKPSSYDQYYPDLEVTYKAPADCVAGQKDVYSFNADGSSVTLEVECMLPTPTPSPTATPPPPTPSGCLDLAGDWSVKLELAGSCCLLGNCQPITPAESQGIVSLTQGGCNVCLPAVLGVSICGPVTNDMLSLSGPFVKCVNGTELENHFNLEGPANLSEFHLTGSGTARCEVQGYVATCTATASMDGKHL